MLKALNHELDAKWREFGVYLHVQPTLMDKIEQNKSDVGDRMLQLVEKWLCREDGTGILPHMDDSGAGSQRHRERMPGRAVGGTI